MSQRFARRTMLTIAKGDFDRRERQAQAVQAERAGDRLGSAGNVAFDELRDGIHASVGRDAGRNGNAQLRVYQHHAGHHRIGAQAFLERRFVRRNHRVLRGFAAGARSGRHGQHG